MKQSILKSVIAAGLTSVFALSTPAFAAEKYEVDTIHSSVVFKVKHMNAANFYGRFNDVTGIINFDDKNPGKSSVELTVQAESVDTNVEKRDNHLRSPDFFNSKQFPVITFKSKKVKKLSNDNYEVTGDLLLHGVTKEIKTVFTKTGTGKDPKGNVKSGGETTFKIKRSDYGMTYMLDMLGDDVTMFVSVEGFLK